MASPSLLAFRHTSTTRLSPASSLLRTQRRYARVHDVRFVTTHKQQEKILDRYKEKLEQKAKQ